MTKEDIRKIVDSLKEKLDETTRALLSEDLIGIIGSFDALVDEADELRENVAKLKTDNEEILKVNGQLFQKVGSLKEETKEESIVKEEEDIPEEEKITIEDVIDEKGEII